MKKRFTIFTVLSIVSAVFTIIFTSYFCSLTAVNTQFAENVDEMIVDGTDFTPVLKTGAFFLDLFMNSMLPMIMYILFFIVITLLNIALFGFYRIFGLRGELNMSGGELGLIRRAYIIFSVLSAVITLVIALCCILFGTMTANCLFALLFCWQYPLFVWAFCLRKLKRSLSAEISA